MDAREEVDAMSLDPMPGNHPDAGQPPPRRRWRRPWRSAFVPVAYGLPVGAAVLAPLTWFSPGRFVAAGDVPPFEWGREMAQATSLWNHQFVGTGSTSYEICRLSLFALVRAADAVGLSHVAAQYLFFASVCGFAAFGAAFLAAVWVRRPLGVAAAGLVAVFNPYLMVNIPNVMPALAIGLIAVLTGLVLRAGAGRPIRPPLFAMATLPASYLAFNPPLLGLSALVVLAGAAAARVLVGAGGTARSVRLLCRSAGWTLLLNLWWLVPYALTLLDRAGLALEPSTDVRQWAWTQVRATVGNVLALNTTWAWGPDTFPFQPGLDSPWWSPLRWALPLLALAGVVLADRPRRRVAWMLGAFCAGLVVLATGPNPPFGPMNMWLLDELPGGWLLRNPAMKLAAPQVLCYAVLAAIAVDRLLRAAPPGGTYPAAPPGGPLPAAGQSAARTVAQSAARTAGRGVPRAAGAVLVVAALAYPCPLWTGAVVPAGNKGDLPGSRVAVPADWYALADLVNRSPVPGKLLVLPLAPYYQTTTTWGYHGANKIPSLLVRRPTIQPLPGGYFRATGSAETLTQGVQSALLRRDRPAATRALRALGVGLVVIRNDLVKNLYGPEANPADLLPGAARTLLPVARRPVASLYRLPEAPGLVTADVRVADLTGGAGGERWENLAGLPVTVADARGIPVDETVWRPGGGGTFTVPVGGRYRLSQARRAQLWRAEYLGAAGPAGPGHGPSRGAAGPSDVSRPSDSDGRAGRDGARPSGLLGNGGSAGSARERPGAAGRRPALRLTATTRISVDGTPLPEPPAVTIPLPRTTVAVGTDRGLRPLLPGSAAFFVGGPATLPGYRAAPARPPRFHLVQRCRLGVYPAGDRRPTDRAPRLAGDGGRACLSAPVPEVAGAPGYLVEFRYRQLSKKPTRVCLWQAALGSCAPGLPRPATGDGWRSYRGVARPTPGAGPLWLYLHAAPGKGVFADYRKVRVRPLRRAAPVRLPVRTAREVVRPLGAGSHPVTVERERPATPPDPVSQVGNCSNVTGRSPAERGLSAEARPGGVLRLRARADIACVVAVAVAPSLDAYRLALRYRTLAGRPARICLWQDGPNRCAPLPPLGTAAGAGAGWMAYSAPVRPAPGTTAMRLFLYAIGQAAPLTTVEYRDISLEPDTDLAVRVRPASATPTVPPELSVTSLGPARHRVEVRGAQGRFALVLAEAAAPGWRLDGLPAGWTARRFTADGYANGWLVTGYGDARLEIAYGPQAYADAAAMTSVLAAGALLGWALALAAGTLRNRRQRRCRPVAR